MTGIVERLRAAAESFESLRAIIANAEDADCEPHWSAQQDADESVKACGEAADHIERLTAERDALALKDKRWHEDFWEVENERRAIAMLLRHAMNSSTPVVVRVREVLEELGAAEARISTLTEALEKARNDERVECLRAVQNIRANDGTEHAFARAAALQEAEDAIAALKQGEGN
jgi:hypothetical protein